jgi:hypothetical protein
VPAINGVVRIIKQVTHDQPCRLELKVEDESHGVEALYNAHVIVSVPPQQNGLKEHDEGMEELSRCLDNHECYTRVVVAVLIDSRFVLYCYRQAYGCHDGLIDKPS